MRICGRGKGWLLDGDQNHADTDRTDGGSWRTARIGALDCIAQGLGQITAEIGFPAELFPVTIVKMFSSSAATGLLLDIYKEYGADSTLGKMASVMMSSTETIFYTMSVYFMSVKVKKTRYTLAGALLATVAGTIASVVIVSYM